MPPDAIRLHEFPGGVHPPEHKSESSETPIAALPLPELLSLPLTARSGPTTPLVEVGETVRKGQLIAEGKGAISVHLHAPTSGTVEGIRELPLPHPSGLTGPCLLLRADGEETWEKLPPLDWRTEARQILLDRIQDAGIAGLGGASFPSHIKLAITAPVDTLIINAAECEPYITCDDRLMRERAAEIIEGTVIAKTVLGCERVILGIEDNKPAAIDAMREAIDTAEVTVEIAVVPTKYPSGGEKQLIQILTGQEVPSGKLPVDMGIVMQNVGTLYAIKRAIVDGEPLISRVVTVTGEAIDRPGNYEVLLGTPFSHLLEETGAGTYSQLIMGGPMMGFELEDPAMPVIKATNCLLAPAPGELPRQGVELPCIRCGACANVCPASLLPQQLYWFARAGEFDKAEEHRLMDCIECGACAYVCPSDIPLVHYYRYAKSEIRTRFLDRLKADHAKERFDARNQRLERLKQERKERHKKAQEARLKQARDKGELDEKKASIEAALKRVEAKKARQQDPASPAPGADKES